MSIDSELVISDYSLHVRTFGGGVFSVAGAEIEGSLLNHRAPRVPGEVALGDYFYTLRRILARFRSTVHLGSSRRLSANRAQLDRYVIRGDPKAARIVECLERLGMLSTDGESFLLDIDRLGAAGINHVDVRNFRATPEIMSFLQNHMVSGSAA